VDVANITIVVRWGPPRINSHHNGPSSLAAGDGTPLSDIHGNRRDAAITWQLHSGAFQRESP